MMMDLDGEELPEPPADPAKVPGWGSCIHGTGVPVKGGSEYGKGEAAWADAPPSFVAHQWMGSASMCVPSVAWLATTLPAPDLADDAVIAAALRLPSDLRDVVLPGIVPPSLAARVCARMPRPRSGSVTSPTGSRRASTTANAVMDRVAGNGVPKKEPSLRNPVSLPSAAPRKVVVAAANCLAGGVFTTAAGPERFFPVSRRASVTELALPFKPTGAGTGSDAADSRTRSPLAGSSSARMLGGRPRVDSHGDELRVATGTRASGGGSSVGGVVLPAGSGGVSPDGWGRWKWLAVATAAQVAMGAAGDPLLVSSRDSEGAADADDYAGGSAASRIVSSLRNVLADS